MTRRGFFLVPNSLRLAMRRLGTVVIFAVAACSSESTVSKIDARTFRIESAGIPGGSETPNRRLAERVCPGGYRVMDKDVHQNSPDRARDDLGKTFSNWTIRCL
jgi:hypothetical protein